jgi:Glycosyl transferase family group 2
MLIENYRKDWRYRFLEAFIGLSVAGFLIILLVLVFVSPAFLAVFLIIYSFLMILRMALHLIYAISSFKKLSRWSTPNWIKLFDFYNSQPSIEKITEELNILADRHPNNEIWQNEIRRFIITAKTIEGTKFGNPNNIIHFPLFSIYDESHEILLRGLRSIFDSQYDLSKICVFISQEARLGNQKNKSFQDEMQKIDWLNTLVFAEDDLKVVYNSDHLELDYSNSTLKEFGNSFTSSKLNLIITQHPDGLVGEIKGKSSNEDWAARQVSLFSKAANLDTEICMVTSFDADSRVGDNFFQILSFQYCYSKNRFVTGFQPMPVFSNNLFDVDLLPFLVGINTTFWTMVQYSLLDGMHFFANYSVPLVLVQRVDFWQRDIIAEDALFFSKCLLKTDGEFQVVPSFNHFNSDNIESDNYWQTITNQYSQLRRWAWGGIESFPYKFYNFFVLPKCKVDIRHRISLVFNDWYSHFCWSTLPVVFSLIVFLPALVNIEFAKSTIALNFYELLFYFSLISYISLGVVIAIIFLFIYPQAIGSHPTKNITWQHKLNLLIPIFISPLIMFVWGPPAIDAQARGVFGKYMGYWVTPKK